mmetsp:Transcript_1695/g.5246  ORF Transcript_1695/g.5246 Transcript_1695/m.5246 type:complete len:366 (-) Transcript_1695:8-1105(-)
MQGFCCNKVSFVDDRLRCCIVVIMSPTTVITIEVSMFYAQVKLFDLTAHHHAETGERCAHLEEVQPLLDLSVGAQIAGGKAGHHVCVHLTIEHLKDACQAHHLAEACVQCLAHAAHQVALTDAATHTHVDHATVWISVADEQVHQWTNLERGIGLQQIGAAGIGLDALVLFRIRAVFRPSGGAVVTDLGALRADQVLLFSGTFAVTGTRAGGGAGARGNRRTGANHLCRGHQLTVDTGHTRVTSSRTHHMSRRFTNCLKNVGQVVVESAGNRCFQVQSATNVCDTAISTKPRYSKTPWRLGQIWTFRRVHLHLGKIGPQSSGEHLAELLVGRHMQWHIVNGKGDDALGASHIFRLKALPVFFFFF